MSPVSDIWTSGEMEMTIDVIRLIALIVLIVVSAAKLVEMQRHTRKWNGLGKALRFEKSTHLILWSWVLLRGIVPGFDHPSAFIVIASLLIWAEVRATLALPIAEKMRIDLNRDRQDAREVTQNIREADQNERDVRWGQR